MSVKIAVVMYPSRLGVGCCRGFSLTEMMIALGIGMLILLALSGVFINSSQSRSAVQKAAEQMENGRYALQLLSHDLANAGFWAELNPEGMLDDADAVPGVCDAPVAGVVMRNLLRTPVQGVDNAAGDATCTSGVLAGTDMLTVRRAATCAVGDVNCATVQTGAPYFQASRCSNASELNFQPAGGETNPYLAHYYNVSTDTTALTLTNRDCATTAPIRRYLTHVYFVSSGGTGEPPVLSRAELSGDGVYTVTPLVAGIENMQLEYGEDTSGDGNADIWTPTPADWGAVVAVSIHLLARNTEPTTGHVDDGSYVLGADAAGAPVAVDSPGDAFKRGVYSTTVRLHNPAGRRGAP